MTLNPWQQYQTEPFPIALNTDSGADNITGFNPSDFTAVIRDTSKGNDVPAKGTFSITTFSPAVVTFSPDDADVLTPGSFQIIITRRNASTGKKKVYDPISWTIVAS